MTIKCKANRSYLTGTTSSVIVFGRVAPIKKTAPDGYIRQCIAEDETGTTYAIYTDYDACIIQSDAIAVPIK